MFILLLLLPEPEANILGFYIKNEELSDNFFIVF